MKNNKFPWNCGDCPVWLADEEVSEKERVAYQQGAKNKKDIGE